MHKMIIGYQNPCRAEQNKMPGLLLIVSQSDYLIHIIDINSHTEWQTVQIQIRKPRRSYPG